MSNTPEPMENISPKGRPHTTAILPPAIADAKAAYERARRVSVELRKTYESLSHAVEPETEPDEEQVEVGRQVKLQLASLGIELASKEKEAICRERELISQEQNAGILQPNAARKRLQGLNQRYFSAGDELWRHQKKKMRLDDPGTVRLLDSRGNALSECLLALYKADGLDKKRKRPSSWRRDALAYYSGSDDYHTNTPGDMVWCHISAVWQLSEHVKAAHIVPFFLDGESIGEILFGSWAESLQRAGNALLLSDRIKRWFDSYHLIVLPVEAKETPIRQWRVDVISADIQNTPYDATGRLGRELDGKELEFLNEKRPVSRFLYFHFIMALIRIRDLQRRGWEDIWAKYYEQRPFPTPGNYMRQSMLTALATHFGSSSMEVVESWIVENGFDSPLKLDQDEATEAARRVHEAVENAISRAEKSLEPGNNSEEEISEEENSEEETSEGPGFGEDN